jgi:uncharacterized FAD-dependent dehydrogenase
MKVKELKEQLEKLDENLEIVFEEEDIVFVGIEKRTLTVSDLEDLETEEDYAVVEVLW